jgi:hypothetical protein
MLSSQDAVAVLRRTVIREPIPNESAMKSALEGSHAALRCRQIVDSNLVSNHCLSKACTVTGPAGDFPNSGLVFDLITPPIWPARADGAIMRLACCSA